MRWRRRRWRGRWGRDPLLIASAFRQTVGSDGGSWWSRVLLLLLLLLGAVVMIEQIVVEIATGKTRLEVRKAAVKWQLVIVMMSTAVGNGFTNSIDARPDGTDGSRRLESSSAGGVNVQIHSAGCMRWRWKRCRLFGPTDGRFRGRRFCRSVFTWINHPSLH